jgi:hypothetical protein
MGPRLCSAPLLDDASHRQGNAALRLRHKHVFECNISLGCIPEMAAKKYSLRAGARRNKLEGV